MKKIRAYGKHGGAKLFGALNYETGKVFYQESESYDAHAFKKFLKSLLDEYPSGKIVMVLDNGRIHKAASIEDFVQEEPRLEFVFLPKYSPELNPIEGLRKWLKSDVVHNVFYDKTYKIRTAVRQFINRVNQNPVEVIDRLCTNV